jgi:hypothetical protein
MGNRTGSRAAGTTRERRVPALAVVLGVFALFVVTVAWALGGSPDRVPGTHEYRSVAIVDALAHDDDRTLVRQLGGSDVTPSDLQAQWQEALAANGEHLRTGSPYTDDRDEATW